MHPQQYLTEAKELLLNKEAYTSSLVALMFDLFAEAAWVGWESDTIERELERILELPWGSIPNVNRDKILIGASLLASNQFYQNLQAFCHTTGVMSNYALDPRVIYFPSIEQCAWAVTEVGMLLGDPRYFKDGEEGEYEFCDDVKAYIGVKCTDEGYEKLPKPLSWAEPPKVQDHSMAAANIGEPFFLADYGKTQDKVAAVDEYCAQRMRAMAEEVMNFPFINKDNIL